jgi:alanine racemase
VTYNAVERTIKTIAKWCNGSVLQHDNDIVLEELVIDSRKVAQPENAMFVALTTQRRDGHSFIEGAYEKGIRNFLVSKDVDTVVYEGANFVKVKDTLTALQNIAAMYRKSFDIPVIGITGSNGKTIVKEWLYELLSEDYDAVRSPKSYNSQIGVPLSVWLLEQNHELGIFEAGISQPGEMEHLEHIILPTIGVFTNIGEAHSEGFLNQRQKINEKLVLFRKAKQLVYCKDYPELNECIAQYVKNIKSDSEGIQLFTWSQKHDDADLVIREVSAGHNKTTITAIYKHKQHEVTIPFTDPASVENAIHCWCVLLLLNVPQQAIAERMPTIQPVSMRLELKHGVNDCTIINDSYNSDLTSLLIALDYLSQQKQHLHHTVVLSDMLQIARPDGELYEEVAELISRRNIQRFIGIGPSLYKHKATFRKYKKVRSIFFKSTDDFLKKFHLLTFNKEAILLKGARLFTFEKVSMLLEQHVHQTVLSINLSSLVHNLNVFRAFAGPDVKLMAMVKAFSYGSGSYEIAHLLQYSGVDYLSVAFTDEGISLRKAGITMPVMVMSPDSTSFDRMIAWKLEPEIFNFHSLRSFISIAKTLKVQHYPVHIKLDTGMHRLGFLRDELDALIQELADNPYIKVATIFSHLAASEDPTQDSFTDYQAALFNEMSNKLVEALGYNPMRHLCNSAAISRHPELHYDMVRLGLGLYGIDNGNNKSIQGELKQISTLKTTIAQVKTIPANETVGYGRRGKSDKETRIATISIGYADGYPRALGNGNAYVLIHNRPAKIVGVVCMDMCMVDVTDIPGAKEGDEAIVFSPDLPLTKLAEWAGTIPYEIMTGISQRVKRVYENEV